MSILIKGLNIPKDDCEAYRELIITNNYIGNGKIKMLAYDSNTNEFIGEVVEVSEPHGRLIDADKLCEYAHNSTVGIDVNDICRFPCVIEAEE